MKARILCLVVVCMFTMLTSGCWDKVEVEQRAIVNAMTIDLTDKAGEESGPRVFCEEKPDRIKVTFGILIPSKVKEGEGAYFTSIVEGADLPDAMEELGSRVPRIPFYGQTRLMVFTERLLNNPEIFKQVLDQLERRAVINEQMKVVTVRGNVEDLPKIQPKLESTNAAYAVGILSNSRVLSNTVTMPLYKFVSVLRSAEGAAVLPVIEVDKEKNELKIDQLALIQDYKFLTYLDSKYVKTYKILTNTLKSGRKLVDYNGIVVPFYIFQSKADIKLIESNSRLKYRVKVEMEGDIENYTLEKNLFDPILIRDIEKAIEKNLAEEMSITTSYFQNVIGHDYLMFGSHTQKYNYRVFQKYENSWDEAFKKAEIVYDVKVNVRRIGTIKK